MGVMGFERDRMADGPERVGTCESTGSSAREVPVDKIHLGLC